jgi:hypothetical protein
MASFGAVRYDREPLSNPYQTRDLCPVDLCPYGKFGSTSGKPCCQQVRYRQSGDSCDSVLGGVDRYDFAVPKGLDIANGRLAKETAVLAAELADALVPNFVGRTGSIKPVHEHSLPCGLQTKLLLILERAHRSQRSELMVKRRHSHARNRRKLLHVQRFGKVGAEPRNRSCGSVAQIARGCDGAEAFSLWRAEDTVDNLPLDQVAEEWNIVGSLEQVDQPSTRVQKADRGLAYRNPARMN